MSTTVATVAPVIETVAVKIRGTAPLVMRRYTMYTCGAKTPRSTKKNYKKFCCYGDSRGNFGIPTTALKQALIQSAMLDMRSPTLWNRGLRERVQKNVFVEGDILDAEEGRPLVKIAKGSPSWFAMVCRLPGGQREERIFARWKEGWEATVTIRFVTDTSGQVVLSIFDLMERAGAAIGLLEGRPSARSNSVLSGFGTFKVFNNPGPKLNIPPPNFQVIPINIIGNAPLVMNKWSVKRYGPMRLEYPGRPARR